MLFVDVNFKIETFGFNCLILEIAYALLYPKFYFCFIFQIPVKVLQTATLKQVPLAGLEAHPLSPKRRDLLGKIFFFLEFMSSCWIRFNLISGNIGLLSASGSGDHSLNPGKGDNIFLLTKTYLFGHLVFYLFGPLDSV